MKEKHGNGILISLPHFIGFGTIRWTSRWLYGSTAESRMNRSRNESLTKIPKSKSSKTLIRQDETKFFLDRFRLDLAELIQYELSDPSIRYLICRQERSLREERFFSPLTAITSSSHRSAQAGCPFLNAWMKTATGKKAMLDFSTAVQACVDGIREEALLANEKNEEGNQMIEELLALKKSSRREVARYAVYLYTRETFLYRVLNTALRDGDHSKVPTLGSVVLFSSAISATRATNTSERSIAACISLLKWSPVTNSRSISGARGPATLRQRNDAKWRRFAEIPCSSFASRVCPFRRPTPTTSNRFSQFPEEEEVLLAAGIAFQILNVDDSSPKKTIIEIKAWSFRRFIQNVEWWWTDSHLPELVRS